jgi:hypothetical protein
MFRQSLRDAVVHELGLDPASKLAGYDQTWLRHQAELEFPCSVNSTWVYPLC